uniref:Family with sequence similarity 83 member Hb n=1 Tax=Hucho hucho TaxID=62062 RepID=A0A4W5KDD9_9TELE
MDMFTDVDLFADLLDATARNVPVYILLDEQNAHHFVSMVTNCKINLDLVHMMRVRTVAGVTYFCRTGKSFKGQVKDRFLLADCRAVLSGNYSFMWSYEKLHRCIAHLFLGELVTTFDEEFRILFAQSQPLTVDHALVPVSSDSSSSYYGNQFGLKGTLRHPLGFQRHTPELTGYPFGGVESERSAFRRDDLFRHAIESGGGLNLGTFAASQQFRMQQSFLDQGRSMVSRQMEISASDYKSQSYAEGTQETYSSSRQYMKHRVINNQEETEQHYLREQSQSSHYYQGGEGPGLMPGLGLGSGLGGHGSGHGRYDKLRNRPALDQYSDSGYPHEEPPGPEDYGRDYLSSQDLKHDPGPPPDGGRYGGGSDHKRPTVGQPYACQSSPTHPNPPEKQLFPVPAEADQDPKVRQGLRSWRINSYLSTYEDTGEEGLPQPLGPDAFQDTESEGKPYANEGSVSRFEAREPLNVPSKPRPDRRPPRYGKPFMPDSTRKDGADSRTIERERAREREREVGVDVEMPSSREASGEVVLSKHESFRTRINPMLQRSSRLRSSLIFSSSKTETHLGGLGMKVANEEDEESDLHRTTSIVQQILEKRFSKSREPFEWRKKAEENEREKKKEDEEKEAGLKEEATPAKVAPESTDPPQPLNMNDPANRLQYFKELAAKRNASKEAAMKGPLQKTPDLSNTTSSTTSSSTTTTTSPTTTSFTTTSSTTTSSSTTTTTSSTTTSSPTTSAPKIPSFSVTAPEPAPMKPQVPAALELTRKLSITSRFKTCEPSTTTVQRKDSSSEPQRKDSSSEPQRKDSSSEPQRKDSSSEPQRKDSSSEPQRKDKEPSKILKPFPFLKPFKSSNPRRVSCDEETLTTDATDAEKSELKKSRSQSLSSMSHAESKEGKNLGSTTSLNTLGGEGKVDTKPLDFLKKQTQKLKGFLGPKDKKSSGGATSASSGDNKTMRTVVESSEESGAAATRLASSSTADAKAVDYVTSSDNHKMTGPSRYQTSSGSVLFSSNLRDDTKVILEQISANSQKNRLERGGEEAGGGKGVDMAGEKGGLERDPSLGRNRFLRPQGNPQERDSLLKRMESMRKEKKVYSRFEMGNNLG